MKQFNMLVLLMSVLISSSSAFGDGLPVPWPFPWAKECPMAWQSLGGQYKMSDSASRDRIIVKVGDGYDSEVKVVRIARLTSRGNIRAFGLAMVFADEREVRVHMIPTKKRYGPDTWITLRMYHSSPIASCDAIDLVPIVTVSNSGDVVKADDPDYILIRVPEERKK